MATWEFSDQLRTCGRFTNCDNLQWCYSIFLKWNGPPRFQQAIFVLNACCHTQFTTPLRLSRPPNTFTIQTTQNNLSKKYHNPPHLPESTCPSQLFLHQHQFSPPFNSPSHHLICGTVDSTPNFRCHELWSATYTIRLLTLLHGDGRSRILREKEVSQKKMLVEISGASPVVPQIFKNNYLVLAILLKHVYYTTKSFKLLSLSLTVIPPCWKWQDQSRWVSHLTSQVWSCRPWRVGWWMTWWCSKTRIA